MRLTITLLLILTTLMPSLFADDASTDNTEVDSATNVNVKPVTAADRHFTLEVLPLLKVKCFGCHGTDPKDIRGDFNMLSREGLLAGGESGEASIVPGKPDDSPLYQAVMWDGYEMPPKENDRLTAEQTALIRDWIKAGAPWPDAARQREIQKEQWAIPVTKDGVIVKTSGGLGDDWTYRRYQPEDLWAFRPVVKPEPPSAADHPVDAFINRKLTEAKLSAAPEASARVLLRRATLDLTGLPPTPEETSSFLADWERDSEAAWSALIDRLLDSPRYGERWGQHWLDVTRYADTGGMSNDFERSNMWRYRDYVIRSFNEDKPWDTFVIEQLAGDELADLSVLERTGNQQAVVSHQLNGNYTPEESEMIVATGFLRSGPWDNAMIKTEEARQIFLDDVVNITGQAFLSTTMRCLKCHDHKFDPIPTRDYYRMYAAFSTTHMAERTVPFLTTESQDGFEEGEKHVRKMLKFATAETKKLVDKREAAARKWFEEHDLPYKNEKERSDLPDDVKPPRHVGLNHIEQGQLKVREQDVWIWNRRLERYQPMAQSVYNAGSAHLAWNGARKLRIDKKADRKVKPKSFILTGGALEARGEEVGPGVLSATGLAVNPDSDSPWRISDDVSGRRLALAKWIAHPDNPLTSRSIVNRIWQQHFGAGIAANPNNFGAKGAKPTHPELLDYLAADFVENGWRIKRLHRLLMTSRAYRRGGVQHSTQQQQTIDPNNALLSHFPLRRLTAEELRDSMLSITGEMNADGGGLPVMPEINMEVALQPRMIQFSLAPAWQPSPTPQQRNRRTIYAYRVRGLADPMLNLFNQPGPNESCEQRDSAAVTPQAFTLLNSDVMTDRSIAFALRLQEEHDSLPRQIDRAISLALGRDSTPEERERLVRYVKEMRTYHQSAKPEPTVFPTEITRSLVEELSGQPFEYTEILPVFEDYLPDVKAADTTAKVRALADLCLLLFNTNEFMFVR